MADYQPDLVAAALRRLDSSPAEFRAAHNRWQAMLRSRRFPTGVQRYLITLGPPGHEHAEQFGDLEVVTRTWTLPELWPELRWQVITDRDGNLLGESLVREPGVPAKPLPEIDAVEPWSCVIGDLAAAHPDAEHTDPHIPSRWIMTIAGGYRATFVWGLLQTVDTPASSGRA